LLARKYKPRLAILDMRMQGKWGMDVARYLRANTSTGFMFLSAFGDSDIIEDATKLGALGYLVKPLDVKQIVPAVRAALTRVPDYLGEPTATASDQTEAAAPSATDAVLVKREQYIAVGIMMERLRLDFDRAFDALRAQAKAESRSVEELSASMVDAANRLNSITR
jgi:response regulator NasT